MASKKSGPARSALAVAAVVFAASFGVNVHAAAQERVVVTFKAGNAAAARAAIARAGGTVVVDLAEVDAFAVSLPAGRIGALKRDRTIDAVHADPVRSIMGGKAPSARRGGAVPMDTTEVVPFGIPMVQADQVTFNPGAGRKVCIIDSGFDSTHPDLQTSGLTGIDLTTTQLGDWNTDENSHGTHVAGTVAALGGNGVGVVGVVPTGTLSLHIAKVFDASGSASSSAIMKGVLNCRKAGANIISMSLGGGAPSNFEARIYDSVANRGILVIAAAGNAGDTTTSYPAGYASVMSVAAIDVNMARAGFSQQNVDVEIAGPGVATLSTVPLGSQLGATTTVGASAYTVQPMDGSPLSSAAGALADFGFGETPVAGSMAGKICLISRGNIAFSLKVQNCEASGGVGAIIYNNTAGALFGTMGGVATGIPSVGALQSDGATMLTQLGQSSTVAVAASSDQYAEYSGTSMATPHVSAVAALVWSNFPGCSAAQIRNALTSSAMDLGAAGRDVAFGFGLVQAKGAVDYLTANPCTAP